MRLNDELPASFLAHPPSPKAILMQNPAPTAPLSSRPLWVVVLSAGLIVGVAMGIRQVMGLYLPPMTQALHIGVAPFSTAMAVANLIWGLGAVLAGMVADRYGAGRVVVTGTVATVVGLWIMYAASSPVHLMVSGVLLGIGVSGTAITALVGAAGRAAPPEKRTSAIASLGMAGGIGGFVAFPYTKLLMDLLGWQVSLLVLSATIAAVLPFAWALAGKPTASGPVDNQTLGGAVHEAFTHPSYLLLNIGFFVCGFHVAFYAVHLPRFVSDAGLPPSVGVWALAAVGLANLVGTYISGISPRFIEKRLGLSIIYFGRCFVFLGLLFLPVTGPVVIILSTLLGLLWLSTVPLTSGLVATFFGTRWMSMLFGVVFFSHQIGSFSGLWLAGVLYDRTKSYDMMWWISIAVGLMAAAVHLPIKDRPVARLAPMPAE
ncbi:MAG TPA: MFS transporter [Hyphomicrobiaceae bacterium]|nr:MFS transporter [Hyphomicrobiaceae bacterium]